MPIGDLSCKFNARSPHLRCAVNPIGPCEGCGHFVAGEPLQSAATADSLQFVALTGDSIVLPCQQIGPVFAIASDSDLKIEARCRRPQSIYDAFGFFNSYPVFAINGNDLTDGKYYRVASFEVNRNVVRLSVAEFDDRLPIECDCDYDCLVRSVKDLLDKPARSPQETELIDLLLRQIYDYDDRRNS